MTANETITIHEPSGKKTTVFKNQFDKPWYACKSEPHVRGQVPDELYEINGQGKFTDSSRLVTGVLKDAIGADATSRRPDENPVLRHPVLEQYGRF